MEVTRKNFKEVLPLVSESIQKADFLTIDTEFTGLMNGRDVSMFDSPSEYYIRLYNGATEFMLVQYGLCAFYWDSKKKQYMNDAYNFYLFPRRPGPDKTFLCSSSSLEFLASQGFDFNKLLKEGISYMTKTAEVKLRDALTGRQKNYSVEKDIITIPEQHKQLIADICKKVRKFLDDKNSDEMDIDKCNNFVRRLLFQELAKFKDEAFIETKVLENQNRVLRVTKLKAGDNSKNRDSQRKEKEWEEFEDAIGFSKVAQMISQSEKLVIGHNMLLDILHTLNHFFQPLPDDYVSFKEFTNCMFPRLLDTKYMSSLPPFKDKINSSVLQHLFTTLSDSPFSIPNVDSLTGRGYRLSMEKHHEAGYDAYVTGLCFLAMSGHLLRMRGEDPARVTQDAPLLKPFLNKLFLAKTAHQDSPYINLVGPDPTPNREHVFHLTFPLEWQRHDITQLFSPFGPITVQFLDDVSAIVALSRRDQARDVTRTLANNTFVTLMPYLKFKHKQEVAKLQQMEHRQSASPAKQARAPESIYRKENHTNTLNTTTSSNSSITRVPRPPSPEKIQQRARSNSVASPAPAQTNRKRSSSGAFAVEEMEPPSKKKNELVKVNDEVFQEEKKDAKKNTVQAFKESDSWD